MSYSTPQSYKMPASYGASGSKGYKLPSISANYPVNRIAGYASTIPVYAGQLEYERLVRRQKEEIKPYKREVKLVDIGSVPELKVSASFSDLGSFLSSTLGSGSKGKGKNN